MPFPVSREELGGGTYTEYSKLLNRSQPNKYRMRYWGVDRPAFGSSCNVLHSHLGLAVLVVSKNIRQNNNTTFAGNYCGCGRYISHMWENKGKISKRLNST